MEATASISFGRPEHSRRASGVSCAQDKYPVELMAYS